VWLAGSLVAKIISVRGQHHNAPTESALSQAARKRQVFLEEHTIGQGSTPCRSLAVARSVAGSQSGSVISVKVNARAQDTIRKSIKFILQRLKIAIRGRKLAKLKKLHNATPMMFEENLKLFVNASPTPTKLISND
jgi:hypothetical protein